MSCRAQGGIALATLPCIRLLRVCVSFTALMGRPHLLFYRRLQRKDEFQRPFTLPRTRNGAEAQEISCPARMGERVGEHPGLGVDHRNIEKTLGGLLLREEQAA